MMEFWIYISLVSTSQTRLLEIEANNVQSSLPIHAYPSLELFLEQNAKNAAEAAVKKHEEDCKVFQKERREVVKAE